MTNFKISKSEARKFLINYHGLGDTKTFDNKSGIVEFINKVGCIQYDPLNVVGRNADLVLQSRISNYKASCLEENLYKSRTLLDGWDKMMAIYSTKDWAYMKRIREIHVKSIVGIMHRRGTEKSLELTEKVKNIIKNEGPKLSREIKIGKCSKQSWGHSKPSSVALDYLYNCGELGIHSKQNTQKVYDLIENILDKNLIQEKDPFKTDREFYKWYIKRRIGSIGMLWERNGGAWLGYYLSERKLRKSIINELLEEKSIVPIKIENIKDLFYIRTKDIHHLENPKEFNGNSIRILAPLDNLLWDRGMIKEIFDFSYTWEVYVPKSKRKYGYYVLPVLYKDKFIARFDPEKQRGNEPLIIKNWWWEKEFQNQNLKNSINNGLKEFCNYLGAETFKIIK